MKTQNLEHAGNLLVPVDESGTATGRPEPFIPTDDYVFHLGLRFVAANGDRIACWQLVKTAPGASFPFPRGSYAVGVIDFTNGRIHRQAFVAGLDSSIRQRFYDHCQAMEGAL